MKFISLLHTYAHLYTHYTQIHTSSQLIFQDVRQMHGQHLLCLSREGHFSPPVNSLKTGISHQGEA